MALGLTQPLTEMSTRNISWGGKVAGAYGWQPYHLHVPTVMKSGSLNLLEPSRPVQACNGIALPFMTTDMMHFGIRTVVFPVRDVGNTTECCDLQKAQPVRDIQEPTVSATWKIGAWRLWWQQRLVICVIHWCNDDTWANMECYTHTPQVALRTHTSDRADGGDDIVHLKSESHFLWIIYMYDTFIFKFHATHNPWLSLDGMNLQQHITSRLMIWYISQHFLKGVGVGIADVTMNYHYKA